MNSADVSKEAIALNMKNAFAIVGNTYRNIDKLFEACKTISAERTEYLPAVDQFLRWKSDKDFWGWYIRDFIMLFQRENDAQLENEWRDGPIYTMEIDLSLDIPTVFLAKLDYADIASWSKGCSIANHWVFYWPVKIEDGRCVEVIENRPPYTIARPKTDMLARKYWGLSKVTFMKINLLDISADNLKEMIFDNFDRLTNLI